MSGKHGQKMPMTILTKASVVLVLVLAISISSIASVIANTVTANVIDGADTYTFGMNSVELDDIIAKAEEMGMDPIGQLDIYERVGNTTTVSVRRGVRVTVSESGSKTEFIAYKGDTVDQTLRQNGIVLKEKDEVTPGKDYALNEDTKIVIERFSNVTVHADGKKYNVSLIGGTVKDALEKANVTIGADDSANYDVNLPLYDEMQIRVSRVSTVKITVDGETKDYKVSAATVGGALEKLNIELEELDRITPASTAKLKDKMEIVIKRVEEKETVKTEEIPFETIYENDDSMYVDESSVKTEGVTGEKEVTYKEIIVDGELESEEKLEEKEIKKAVDKVVIKGTKEYPKSSNTTGGTTSISGGTVIDTNGNVVSYGSMLSGSGTAYCDDGYTAIGDLCGYGYVAVNPNIIPYGSRLYICSADGSYTYGYAIASDTGGALMAGDALVDIWLPTESECINFGRRTMNVYILN